ncbi:MAG: putative flippase GtrA [Oceanospirillaceae bacterium]|jgi:putative flippase GtrA
MSTATVRQLIRFLVVGIIATTIHLTLSFLLMLGSGFTLMWANISAFFVVFLFSYYTNTSWSFSTGVNADNFKKYLCVALGNVICIAITASYFDSDYESKLVGVFVISSILPSLSFTLQKFWVYNN